MAIRKTAEFIEHVTSIFNLRTIGLCAIAVTATALCIYKGWTGSYPLALAATAVIFPIVFAINSAYQRRELALGHYAAMKAHLRSLYFAMTNWHSNKSDDDSGRILLAVSNPLFAVRDLITNPSDEMRENEVKVYESFSELSSMLEDQIRKRQFMAAEIGCCQNYLTNIMSEFEKLKHIYQYRTPRALQAFSDVFITLLPVLYAPVFAGLALEMEHPYIIYAIPALFAFVLSSLDNIQADLEDPFDGIGVDDIVINAEIFKQTLISDDGTLTEPLPLTDEVPVIELGPEDVRVDS